MSSSSSFLSKSIFGHRLLFNILFFYLKFSLLSPLLKVLYGHLFPINSYLVLINSFIKCITHFFYYFIAAFKTSFLLNFCDLHMYLNESLFEYLKAWQILTSASNISISFQLIFYLLAIEKEFELIEFIYLYWIVWNQTNLKQYSFLIIHFDFYAEILFYESLYLLLYFIKGF